MQSKWIQLSVHIAAWMLFFSLPAIFMPQYDFTGESNSYVDSYFLSLHFLVTNLLLVAIFYFNALVLMPRLFFKKRFLEYALLVAALLVVFIYIPTLFRTAVAVAPPPPPHLMNLENMNDYFSHRNPVVPKSRYEFSVFVFLIIWLLSTGIKITEEWLHSEKKAKEIEAEKLNTELTFLKTQINPHFLFNTLNTIYMLALSKSDVTAEAVMKLSNLMRYVIDEASAGWVPLEKELNYIDHYIELQRIRLSTKIVINMKVDNDGRSYLIAPLILMPFIENAFKYGTSAHEHSEINIAISIFKGVLDFHISNPVFAKKQDVVKTGIGIENTERRLNLVYPEKHQLSIIAQPNSYQVHLNLQLR
jgi:two-component system, LytTR family, sensor kinase